MGLMRNIIGYGLILSKQPEKESHRKRLTKIIRHANTHCPYYKGRYADFLQGERSFSDEEFDYAFSHLPITNKEQLSVHNPALCSDRFKKKGEKLSCKELLKACLYKKDLTTSIPLNQTKARRWLDHHDIQIYAHTLCQVLKKNGWKRGKNLVAFMPENIDFIQNLSQRNAVLYHLFGLTILPFKDITQDNVADFLRILDTTKATTLLTQPHTLLRIAQIMHKNSIPPCKSLKAINISGSFFPDCNKQFIQNLFPESDIQCSYSTPECGIIAHQSSLNSYDYDVLSDYVFLEQGANNSILVTTCHQKTFPLIRYKLEDMGQIVNCEDGTQKIKALEGSSKDHLIGADGYMYFPSFFNLFVNEMNNAFNDVIIDFMIRHNKTDYLEISFSLTDNTKKEKIRKAAQEILSPIFSNYKRMSISFPQHITHNDEHSIRIIYKTTETSSYQKFEQRQPTPPKEQNRKPVNLKKAS